MGNFFQRSLSLKGRALTSNTLLASRIWYTSYIFPPLLMQADKIQRIVNNWARKDSKTLPSANLLQVAKKEGGWNLCNIRSGILARTAMMGKKLLFSEEIWPSSLERTFYLIKKILEKFIQHTKKINGLAIRESLLTRGIGQADQLPKTLRSKAWLSSSRKKHT